MRCMQAKKKGWFMTKAKILEIFSSIQGEGLYVGQEQTFVRFYGCNLSCKFCDERHKRNFMERTASEVIDKVIDAGKSVVSITGGEPLMQSDFLKEILPSLREKNLKIYLETNGTLDDKLLDVLELVDIISMDFKLPSSTGIESLWQEHERFLKIAMEKELFVKSVITPQTSISDIKTAAYIVSELNEDIPFILQPVSYNNKIKNIELLPAFFQEVKETLNNVRVIPQIHKIMGMK